MTNWTKPYSSAPIETSGEIWGAREFSPKEKLQPHELGITILSPGERHARTKLTEEDYEFKFELLRGSFPF